MYISIDGQIMPSKNALISSDSEGCTYGYGVFETIKFQDHKIHHLKEHLKRMKESLHKIHLSFEIEDTVIKEYCHTLMEVNQLSSGAVKIMCIKDKEKTKVIISTKENHYKKEDYNKGFRICFTDVKRNPHSILTYIKSNNYMENYLIRQQTLKKGYHEVVYTNIDDKISEGSLSNLFFIKGDTIYTPAIYCGLLPGIMREKVIELVRSHKIKIQIGQFTKEDLMTAEEVFITNSLLEIMPVSLIDDKALDLNRNTVTKELIRQYQNYIINLK